MRTETITIYKFNELSEEAKQKAISEYKDNTSEFTWTREWLDSLEKGLKNFGAELKDCSIDPLNINCSSWRIVNNNTGTDEMSGQRLRTWLVNNYWGNFYERKHYGEYRKIEKTGKYKYQYYSKCQQIETSCPFTGFCGDEDFMDVFREFLRKPDSRTFDELLEDATEKLLRGMENDCEYQLSDEFIAEELDANEYEFNEDGRMY